MINVEVREATPADVDQLAALRYEFRSTIGRPSEDRAAFLQRCSAWMSSRLSQGWKCWVASSQRDLVGQIWLVLLEKMPNPVGDPERHAYITNFYLKPEFRGGIGSMLLTRALDWLSQQAVDAVILWPTPRSRSLYQRYGFEQPADMLELRRRALLGR